MAARGIEEVFLFVNPKSGGNKGQLFMKVPQPFEVLDESYGTVSLRIFSLLEGKPGDKPGFHALAKTLSDPRGPRHVKVIVGGGDGTIMWVVQEAEMHGIGVKERLHMGIVPLGTGNDFSRAAGWGGTNPPDTMLDDGCKYVRNLVHSWTRGRAELHDVWHVKLDVDDENGQIVKIGDKEEKVMEYKCIESPMLNYLSIGQDSQTGFDFEKNRQKSQLGNIMQYACSGLKVSAETFSSDTISDVVQGLYHGKDKDGAPIFCTDEDERAERGAPRLRKDPHILLVLNIKSYCGGKAPRLWQASVRRYGVDPPSDSGLLGRSSHPGDGKLDVLTLRYAARVITGSLIGGRRVFWGAPLYFDFHEYSDADNACFMNIDGEFFKAINPTSMCITSGGQLMVLHHSEGSMANLHKAHPKEIEEETETEDEDGHTESPMFGWLGCCMNTSLTEVSEPS